MGSLKHTQGRVVVRVDLDSKDHHRFADGTDITLVRRVNNMNRRYTEPVNATVISAENIKEGAEILIHHNSTHDVNRIFDYEPFSGTEAASRVKYFSIPVKECFLYRENEQDGWRPLLGFATGLRVFKPYSGVIQNIAPTQIPDVLYVTSGELKGKVVHTLRSCDYEIVYQDKGREARTIRFRHWDDGTGELDPKNADDKREEVVCINDYYTKRVLDGEYYIGLDASSAKPIDLSLGSKVEKNE